MGNPWWRAPADVLKDFEGVSENYPKRAPYGELWEQPSD
jgi:hypothetical protein